MQGDKPKPVIAAFDFDGTITYRDTTFFFLLYVAGTFRAFLYFFLNIPILISFLIGKSDRQKTKERIFQSFFKGMSIEEVRKLGEDFAERILPKHVRKEALERITWHQARGHKCVLVSASIDAYLEPWAKKQGFFAALTSRLAVDEKGRVSGRLDGLNCRKEEKVRRLEKLLGPLENFEIYAYGDSDGDKELLEAAAHPFHRVMPKEEVKKKV